MKKGLVIALAVLMVVAFSGMAMAGEDMVFNLKAEVLPYIETGSVYNIVIPDIAGPDFKGYSAHSSYVDFGQGGTNAYMKPCAYANCPFKVQFSGSNKAGDGFPRLAKEQAGAHAFGRFDRLAVKYLLDFYIDQYGGDAWGVKETYWDSQMEPPATLEFAEAPHTGQIGLIINLYINQEQAPDGYGPITAHIGWLRGWKGHKTPEWDLSPDAGLYKATLITTYVPWI